MREAAPQPASSPTAVSDLLGPDGLAGLRSRILAPGYALTRNDEATLVTLAVAAEQAASPHKPVDQLLFDVFYADSHHGFDDELGDAICRSGALDRIDPAFTRA